MIDIWLPLILLGVILVCGISVYLAVKEVGDEDKWVTIGTYQSSPIFRGHGQRTVKILFQIYVDGSARTEGSTKRRLKGLMVNDNQTVWAELKADFEKSDDYLLYMDAWRKGVLSLDQVSSNLKLKLTPHQELTELKNRR